MLSSDAALPYDRPNLSKDYLAGTIPFDYVPLRDDSFYEENGIEIQLGKHVSELDLRAHEVLLSDGERVAYDRLLLATGAPLPIATRSLKPPRQQSARSLSAPASLGSKSLPRSELVSSKSMSLHPTSVQWNVFSGQRWAISFAPYMKSTG